MRLLIILVASCGFSSCVAFALTGSVIAIRASEEQREEVEGYERLLVVREREARTAAVIRERWNQANPSSTGSEAVLSREPSAPPLLTAEPARRPLRPAPR
ncbi:MAG: hypothetical protein Q8S33_06105 [Myxococcales bacterium]|nr:hypothetical protein [Myxococcales bacterium]MDP3499883.1 hypothetical protein [Myxococcales bacterium]